MSLFDGLDLVHSFRVLAEELSFRRAAARLNLDQSALSRRISKLEHVVGCTLVERTTRHATLTAAGRAFYSDNRGLLDGFARAVETAQAIARGHSGTLTVGYMAFAAGDLMPRALARFRAARPHVAVTLRYISSQVQKIQLAAGDIDVGYVVGPLDHQDFAHDVVACEPLYLLLPDGHDLLGRPSIAPSALEAIPLALGDLSEWETFRQRLQEIFGRHGVGLAVAYQSANVLALIGLVRAGLAATILPESLLPLAGPGIGLRRIEGDDVRISTVVAWRRNPSPIVADFVACARARRLPILHESTSLSRWHPPRRPPTPGEPRSRSIRPPGLSICDAGSPTGRGCRTLHGWLWRGKAAATSPARGPRLAIVRKRLEIERWACNGMASGHVSDREASHGVEGDVMVTRRSLMAGGALGLAGAWSSRWFALAAAAEEAASAAGAFEVSHTEAEWRKRLTPDQFVVLRQSGTERPFTSPLNDEHRRGTFACAGCEREAFSSTTKFDSHTGWPSFWAPLEGAVGQQDDRSYGMVRSAIHCSRCGGHLGHVFNDGPQPTGLRYCMNGVALTFKPAAA